MLTESEEIFLAFCSSAAISCHRIGTVINQPTPDFELRLSQCSVVVEVKGLTPSRLDEEVHRELRETGSASFWGDSIPRLRARIKKSGRQLKAPSLRGLRTVCAVVDLPRVLRVDHDDVLQAMYGDDSVWISPPTHSATPRVIGAGLGGHRMCTATHNTSLSALGILARRSATWSLALFHNHWARHAIDPAHFMVPGVSHYIFDPTSYSQPPQWRRVAPSGT